MKSNIHPEYGPATIRCACGNVIESRSTIQGDMQVDICSGCHPFFTGKQKFVDTTGRIDRFKKKFGARVALGRLKRPKQPKVIKKKAEEEEDQKSAEKKA